MKIDVALEFIDMVKEKYIDQPAIYSHFLKIMREYNDDELVYSAKVLRHYDRARSFKISK